MYFQTSQNIINVPIDKYFKFYTNESCLTFILKYNSVYHHNIIL